MPGRRTRGQVKILVGYQPPLVMPVPRWVSPLIFSVLAVMLHAWTRRGFEALAIFSFRKGV